MKDDTLVVVPSCFYCKMKAAFSYQRYSDFHGINVCDDPECKAKGLASLDKKE